MNKNLYDLILEDRKDNNLALEELILRFEKLIKKYAYMLKYEDAQNDLILHFIKVIKNISLNENMKNEPILISYLSKSIRNEYIRLSKEKQKYDNLPLNLEIKTVNNLTEIDFDYVSDLLNGCLTKKEKAIMSLIYIDGYKVSDVSKVMHISRQAVNQCKNRSLSKLRYFIESNDSIFL